MKIAFGRRKNKKGQRKTLAQLLQPLADEINRILVILGKKSRKNGMINFFNRTIKHGH
ncbi:MAG: hypothetical protein GY862_05795 [Gammaproteobacteria bacterium]|nr:hypothetical protein [Gammaproteobacteria bacterium]